MRSERSPRLSRAIRFGAAALLMAVPAIAFASGGAAAGAEHHDGIPLKEIALHAVNLGLLLGLLGYLARGKIGPALAARRQQIAHDIESAARAEAEAQAQLAEVTAKLAGFDAELERMRSEADRAAADEHRMIVAKAREDAETLRRAAERSLREEGERARAALRAEAARIAIDLATTAVVSQINEEDHKRLDREFLSSVGAGQTKAEGVHNG